MAHDPDCPLCDGTGRDNRDPDVIGDVCDCESPTPGVTYRGAYGPWTITLCDAHLTRAPWPLGPVEQGLGVDPAGCHICAEDDYRDALDREEEERQREDRAAEVAREAERERVTRARYEEQERRQRIREMAVGDLLTGR